MTERPINNNELSMTRRQALQLALVTGGSIVGGSFLTACNDSTSPGSGQQTASITPTPRNQTLVVDQSAQFAVFDSFNPFIPNGQEYETGFGQICKEFLFYYNLITGETKPWLAKGWEYNPDHTQLTLKLNPKAHWNDGTPFTAKDVVFTLQMLLQNDALIGSSSYTPFVKQAKASDDQTVVIDLKIANPRFHYNFICGIVNGQEIVPEHIWSKQNPLTFKASPPVWTGPYKLDRTIPSQFMYIWKKDPNYWNKDELDPKPEYVVYRTTPSTDSEVEQFKRGQVDVPAFDYQHAVAIKNQYSNIAIEQKFRDPCPRAIAINCDPSKGLLADPRMHWAISYLIDRKMLGSTVWSVPTPPAQFPWADYPSNEKWSDQSIAAKYQLTYDPKKAAALLDEMGAKLNSSGKRTYNGQPLQYEIMTPSKIGDPEYIYGQKLADELNKIGIGANVRYYDGTVWTNKFNNGQFDITTYYICGEVFDPGQLYSGYEISKTKPINQDASVGGNIQRVKYTDLDSLATQLDHTDPGSSANMALFNQALETYYKDMPIIPVTQTTYPTIFNTSYWTNWPTDDNLYQVPSNWWGQFLFVVGSLKPTGKA
ncbi:ABC transporter substrate-binding protein [Ktedonobacter racemifer]|uniref:Extracellular solute-binding protein family 5 n=1 Tax=Ktedonobacter racemifer DSM 44963 TaxID=485913 RepID=D6TWS6_KTERA|nr:ABC transporter substrate-binding protein [Ktedonobacter racemifer]EFH84659.1 extracellular solute-binding protein family 5 [Ktedonobacter racemifer DSM 44963]